MEQGWLVVDIGGTKLSAAIFDGRRLSFQNTVSTEAHRGREHVVKRLISLMDRTAGTAQIRRLTGIGVACPGPLSARRGLVIRAPMLGWESVPIADIIAREFGCPVALENDANAAALGEYVYGAGRGASSMAYITVSTGVGCGVVLQGKLLRGHHESAGELGHMVIRHGGRPCACGRYGCLEGYASGTAIGREASRLLSARGQTALTISAKDAAALARQGDTQIRQAFADAGFYLGRGVAALLQIVDPEKVVVGGSVARSFDLIESGIREGAASESYWGRDEGWLVRAQLDGASGLLGAAVLISNYNKGGT